MTRHSKEWFYEKQIKLYNYRKFSKPKEVGRGGYGTVYKVAIKRLDFALKKLIVEENDEKNEKTIRKNDKEIDILQEVCEHPNIVRFYGVVQETLNGPYHMVLQFASNGNLREYMKACFPKLKWARKLRMALEISEGIAFLHQKEIIHQDLHPENILVHEGTMLITDFGLAKKISETTLNSGYYGKPRYKDPQCIIEDSHICDKECDIFSFGVILWEISSGRQPFDDDNDITGIIFQVYQGKREEPLEGTPLQYIQLYKKCWDSNSHIRPKAEEVFNDLVDIIMKSDKSQKAIYAMIISLFFANSIFDSPQFNSSHYCFVFFCIPRY
ncbi:kinase-like protein [Gigaspora margarita]|uniref:Kinase-like protein n=1 Tax=Gigaspora margarita TaxID=4874 RepID=A0A8H3XHI2_GIGMA|nr:kinase-like protein [Gigaspora margarita]